MSAHYLLAIDQGTTSSRAIIFDKQGRICGQAQKEFTQHYPHDGWVEHDANEIWIDTLQVCRQAISNAYIQANQIAGIGITNQRETTVIWHRDTGEPIANAIVWQDRRTTNYCDRLKVAGHEPIIQAKTGLLLDPYFSATKIAWLLDNTPNARQLAEEGKLAFGTIDSWLLWNLTNGKVHATDASNASRTLLFNIHTQQWDDELLKLFNIPSSLLPDVKDNAANYGNTAIALFGTAIPIAGMAGDQQAALFGQACFNTGMVKSTYGTGCFMMLNTGNQAITSENRLLTTVGYRLNNKTTYALEGSIFVAGAAIQWLRDGLRLIEHASDTEQLAHKTGTAGNVYLVPAFTGLGAPWWDPHARGALLGLTRDTGIAEIVTAGLEAVCYQTKDLLNAMVADAGNTPTAVRVDGGMVVNNWLTQRLADLLGVRVDRPTVVETTALGAAYLAGLQVGMYTGCDDISQQWQCEREFSPKLDKEERQKRYEGWLKAVSRVRSTGTGN